MSSPITSIDVASPIVPASASTLLWSMEQMQRPSDAHSGLILASHVAFAVGLITAARQRQAVEGAVLAAVVICSLLYHVCDENIYCAAGRDIHFWHAADVWGTFVFSLAVLGVACLRLPQRLASLVRVLYVAATTAVVATDPGSPILLGALLLSLVVALAVRHLVLAHRYPSQGDGALLLKSLGSYAFAQVVFLLANDPQWGGGVSDYVPAVHGATKPMHIPDTRVYWLYHSLWHVGAAYAAHYALLFAASSSAATSLAKSTKKLE